MKSALIGYTGFVGSNLKNQYIFSDLYNSKNYLELKDTEYDTVVCAGIPAAMWMANKNPDQDLKLINDLLDVIKTMKVKYFVLISSIAVYKSPVININEDSKQFENNIAYGKNRRYAETVIQNKFNNYSIIRLPALFGNNLKKNFLYDLKNQEPAFLTEAKLAEIKKSLSESEQDFLAKYYIFDERKNMYVFSKELAIKDSAREQIIKILNIANFTALNFTNSESFYQFYSLNNLWKDINIAIENNIKELNICSEPLQASDIAKKFFNIDLTNDNGQVPFNYDMHTKYAGLWNKTGNYQYSKNDILAELEKFFNT